MTLDIVFPIAFAVLGIALIGVSKMLPALSPGRAPTERLRQIDIRILLFWEGVGMLVAALAISIAGVESDIVRAAIVIGVVLGASGIWGVIQAMNAAAVNK